jgi:uncharacterized protein (TIGR03066 family)
LAGEGACRIEQREETPMKTLCGVAAALLVAVLAAAPAVADEKIDKKNLVGVWEGAKDGALPPGATIEFTKDGKLKMSIEVMGKKNNLVGTYKVDGNKLTVTMKDPGGKEATETDTIKTLTADKLVIHSEKEKKDLELKKKK